MKGKADKMIKMPLYCGRCCSNSSSNNNSNNSSSSNNNNNNNNSFKIIIIIIIILSIFFLKKKRKDKGYGRRAKLSLHQQIAPPLHRIAIHGAPWIAIHYLEGIAILRNCNSLQPNTVVWIEIHWIAIPSKLHPTK